MDIASVPTHHDLADKTRIYARAGMAGYWIVNLVGHRVEVYTNPSGPTAAPAYGTAVAYTAGDAVPLVLKGVQVVTVLVADLLP